MSILDPQGNPVSSQANTRWIPSATKWSGTLPYEPTRLDDFDKLVPTSDWRVVNSVSKRLFVRTGIVRGAVIQRATQAVGSHWLPVFRGADQNWGKLVQDILINEWFSNCDVRGMMFDWQTLLKVDSITMDREGDFGILLLDSEYPMSQRIGSHRIGQRDQADTVKGGPFSGAKISNGVILNRYDTPIGYRILGKKIDGSEDQDVDVTAFIHVFDPHWHDQQRGLPIFVHALNDLRSGIYSQNWELLAQMIVSSIGLVEYNEYGQPDESNPNIAFREDVNTGDKIPTYEEMYGGMIRYFKSNSGGKLEQIKQERPGDMWESFQDRIIRAALAGVPWPYSLVWKTGDLNGVTQRTELLKAQGAVRERQMLTSRYARRWLSWAVAKFIKMGRIPPNDEWWKWAFTTPPRMGIDPGKEAKANESEFAMGTINMDMLVGERTGNNLESHYRERAHQVQLKQRIAKEFTDASNGEFPVLPDDLGKTPTQGGSPPANAKETPPEGQDDPPEDELTGDEI